MAREKCVARQQLVLASLVIFQGTSWLQRPARSWGNSLHSQPPWIPKYRFECLSMCLRRKTY
ncbi:hypothetical protein RSAG8_01219, partial [Rhizoctonia solani AG-8 WAC10335]